MKEVKVPLAATLLSSSNMVVTRAESALLAQWTWPSPTGGLFKCRDDNLGEALKILDGVAAKGVSIADLDDAVDREVQRWSEGSPRRLRRELSNHNKNKNSPHSKTVFKTIVFEMFLRLKHNNSLREDRS